MTPARGFPFKGIDPFPAMLNVFDDKLQQSEGCSGTVSVSGTGTSGISVPIGVCRWYHSFRPLQHMYTVEDRSPRYQTAAFH